MQVIIKTKNLELTDALNVLVNKRMQSLGRFTKILKGDFSELFVEIEKSSKHHRKGEVFSAEAIIVLPGKKLVARATGENLGKAITEVKESIEREIRKYKTQTVDLPRRKYQKGLEKAEGV